MPPPRPPALTRQFSSQESFYRQLLGLLDTDGDGHVSESELREGYVQRKKLASNLSTRVVSASNALHSGQCD